MAVAFGTIGAKVITGTTTVAIAYPASVAAGDLLIAGRAGGNQLITLLAEAGWTHDSVLGGLVGTNANDSHQTAVASDYVEAVGGETGTVTFDQGGTPNGVCGIMARYTKAAGQTWDVVQTHGDDNTHGANRSAAAVAAIPLTVGDVLVGIVAVDTDASLSISAPSLFATGITFTATTARAPASAGYITGNDGNIYWFDATVTAGTNTVAPTFSFTTATTQCGPVAFVRLREVAPPAAVPPVLPTMAPHVPSSPGLWTPR